MATLLHELHPSLVHAPLTLLPGAAIVDLLALSRRSRGLERVGRALWVAGVGSAALAGVTGFAASQQVRADDPAASDMLFLHGAGNTLILAGATAVMAWRLGHRPSLFQVGVGLAACGAAVYTASLGGRLVYEHGVGVNAMPPTAPGGTLSSPRLFSREAPSALARDAGAGLRWIVERALALFSRRQPLDRRATGFTARAEPLPPPVREQTFSPRP